MKHHSWSDLDAAEQANLERAVTLVAKVEPISLDFVEVVDFRGTLLGQCKDGKLLLGKHILADRATTLETLVHEAAHRAGGGDGEHAHVANIERIWSAIVEALA